MSAHTYADLGLVALDIFTCGETNPHHVLTFIREEIDLGETTIREFSRFPEAGDRSDLAATSMTVSV